MQDVYLQVTAVRPDQRAALVEDFKRREHESQLVGFRKTLEMHPDDPWSHEGLAGCYLAMGRPAPAIELLEERLKLGPVELHAVAILGMACLAGGDGARAERHMREALEMDDAYPFA